MKITILMGSPRKVNTEAMVQAFKRGAESANHEVTVFNVCDMNISGCKACEYCHGEGEGECIQKDDMQYLYPTLKKTEMIVFASPIYYFTLSAQLQAVIHRMYSMKKLPNASKAMMLLSSKEPGVFTSAVEQYKGITNYMGIKDLGVLTADDTDNGSKEYLKMVESIAGKI